MKRKPKKVFEVGIGNGYPIGVALSQNDIKVYGCDVAKSLVESARRNLHNDEIWVGELKNIKMIAIMMWFIVLEQVGISLILKKF